MKLIYIIFFTFLFSGCSTVYIDYSGSNSTNITSYWDFNSSTNTIEPIFNNTVFPIFQVNEDLVRYKDFEVVNQEMLFNATINGTGINASLRNIYNFIQFDAGYVTSYNFTDINSTTSKAFIEKQYDTEEITINYINSTHTNISIISSIYTDSAICIIDNGITIEAITNGC